MSDHAQQAGAPTSLGAPADRVVHARSKNGIVEVVRYDRQGRWYEETVAEGRVTSRNRLKTAQHAVGVALGLEGEGGEVFLGRPGGNRFDYMVGAARQKGARGR